MPTRYSILCLFGAQITLFGLCFELFLLYLPIFSFVWLSKNLFCNLQNKSENVMYKFFTFLLYTNCLFLTIFTNKTLVCRSKST